MGLSKAVESDGVLARLEMLKGLGPRRGGLFDAVDVHLVPAKAVSIIMLLQMASGVSSA